MVAPFYFLWTTKAIAKGRYGYRCCYEIVAQALASSGPMTLRQKNQAMGFYRLGNDLFFENILLKILFD